MKMIPYLNVNVNSQLSRLHDNCTSREMKVCRRWGVPTSYFQVRLHPILWAIEALHCQRYLQ